MRFAFGIIDKFACICTLEVMIMRYAIAVIVEVDVVGSVN